MMVTVDSRSLDTVVTEVGDIVQTLAHNQTNTMNSKYLGKDNNILLQKLIYRLLDTNNSNEVISIVVECGLV